MKTAKKFSFIDKKGEQKERGAKRPLYILETPSLKELSLEIITKYKLETPNISISIILKDITKDMYIL